MDKSPVSAKATKNRVGNIFSCSSGALGWLIPVPNDSYQVLTTLCSQLHTSLEHVGGLNPRTFRGKARELSTPYGAPAPLDGVLDFELLLQFCMLPRSEQKEVAGKHGVAVKAVVQSLCQLQACASFF